MKKILIKISTSYVLIFSCFYIVLPPLLLAEEVTLISPIDKVIVYEDKVYIAGLISGKPGPEIVYCNNEKIMVKDKKILHQVPLSYGKNIITIEYQQKDQTKSNIYRRLLRLISFPDISAKNDWAKRSIEELATLGVITPYQNGKYQPDKGVERAELAATLVKIRRIPLPNMTDEFCADVSLNYWGTPYIAAALDKGLITLYPDQTFKPTHLLTKAEALGILLAFAGIAEPQTITSAPYEDVPIQDLQVKVMTATKRQGLLRESKKGNPNDIFTRAELAYALSKLPELIIKIDDLYDWDHYVLPTQSHMEASDGKPKLESIVITPNFMPSDLKTVGKIYLKISHPNGFTKITKVSLAAKALGWPENSQIFFYDDGKSYQDKIKNDGIYTTKIVIFNTVNPGLIKVPITIEDSYHHKVETELILNVVSNLNGTY